MRLAVLIDAENVSHKLIEPILAEVATLGTPAIRRVYGDFSLEQARVWQAVALRFAIQPVQQYQYSTGKNSSDFALVIDAMDLLHGGHVDGFCIVSSDSDFTRLATRLREAGKTVYGIGGQKTPAALIAACDRFIYTSNLAGPEAEAPPARAAARTVEAPKAAQEPVTAPSLKQLGLLIGRIVDDLADGEGRASVGPLGSRLQTERPEFDPRTYKHRKLTDLIDALPQFAVERVKTGGGTTIFVRRTGGPA